MFSEQYAHQGGFIMMSIPLDPNPVTDESE